MVYYLLFFVQARSGRGWIRQRKGFLNLFSDEEHNRHIWKSDKVHKVNTLNKQTEPLHVLVPGIKSPGLAPFLAAPLTSSVTLSSQVLPHFTILLASIQPPVVSRATEAIPDNININLLQDFLHLTSRPWIPFLNFPLLSQSLARRLGTSRSTIPTLLVKIPRSMSAEKVFAAIARAAMVVLGRSTASPASSATIAIATAPSRHFSWFEMRLLIFLFAFLLM